MSETAEYCHRYFRGHLIDQEYDYGTWEDWEYLLFKFSQVNVSSFENAFLSCSC